jgi:hypothetical protein
MRIWILTLGVLAAAICMLVLPAPSTAASDRGNGSRSVIDPSAPGLDPAGFVRQNPSPIYNFYTGRPVRGGQAHYNPLTGNYQWPGEVFNLYTGRPVGTGSTYNNYMGPSGYGYWNGNGWVGQRPSPYNWYGR